jgi:hypothetical protein
MAKNIARQLQSEEVSGYSMFQHYMNSQFAEQHQVELIERGSRERMVKDAEARDDQAKSLAGGRALRSILAALSLLIGRAS